jgi:hypothetical protein
LWNLWLQMNVWPKKIFHPSLFYLFLDPGSGIRDPGSGMGKNQDPGSGIRDKHPGSATLNFWRCIHISFHRQKKSKRNHKNSRNQSFFLLFLLVNGMIRNRTKCWRIRIRDPKIYDPLIKSTIIFFLSICYVPVQKWNISQFCKTYAPKKGKTTKYFPLFCCCFCCWIRDPISGMDKNQDPGSLINIPDTQHCL